MNWFGSSGQSSLEFIVIMGVLLLIVLGTFGIVQSRMYSVVKEKNDVGLESVGNIIRSEFRLASSIKGDYYREFTLPEVVDGSNYSITITGPQDISLKIEDREYLVFLNENITGTVHKGVNVIKKVNENITVNV